MVLAALYSVDKYYGEQTVLARAHLELRPSERLALIGRNGAGKTTVLRLLTGTLEPDGGEVLRRADVTFGLLDQHAQLEFGGSKQPRVADVAQAAFTELDAMERELEALEGLGLDHAERYRVWEELHQRFQRRGGYERRARRDAVLHALGFGQRHHEEVAHLSGGERTRLALATLLMSQPDVLLLDEPTNHLDLEMRAYLASFIARYPGAALIVSHDRAFLDAACDRTADVDRGTLRVAAGNPSETRAARLEAERIQTRTVANQQREESRLRDAAEQMKRWAGQNAKLHRRAKSMERRLERYQAEMLDPVQAAARSTRFLFPCSESASLALEFRDLSVAFSAPLFTSASASVRSGERVAITGPNGAGKTTLLRTILGSQPSSDPRAVVRWGARTRVAHFDQSLAGLDPDLTLVDTLIRLVGEREAHNLLGRMLFPFDAQFKKVAQLSGGERARLAIVQLTLSGANVLVLDEPTNHLDVEMIEALEAALHAYQGTVLFVSHDQRFIESLATRVWRVADGVFEDFDGDWGYAQRQLAKKATEPRGDDEPLPEPRVVAAPLPASRSRWQLQRDLEREEAEVLRLEEALALIEAELMAEPPATVEAIAELGRAHGETSAALDAAVEAWGATAAALEGLAG